MENIRYLEITAKSEAEARSIAERELSSTETITGSEVLAAPARGMFGVIGDPEFRIRFAIGGKPQAAASPPPPPPKARVEPRPLPKAAVKWHDDKPSSAVRYDDDLDEEEDKEEGVYDDVAPDDMDFSEEDGPPPPPRTGQAREPRESRGPREPRRGPSRHRAERSIQVPADLIPPTHPDKPRKELAAAFRENPMYQTIHEAILDVARLVGVDEAKAADYMVEDIWVIDINGTNVSQLIGKRGRTLDALQYVLNICWNKGNDERQKLVLDVQGYREKRHRGLIQLANRMSRKVLDSGRPVELEPMSTLDRRTIHLALKDQTGVETFSKGVEPMRRVVIAPRKGAKPQQAPGWNQAKPQQPRRRPAPQPMEANDEPQPVRSRSVPMFIEEDPSNET